MEHAEIRASVATAVQSTARFINVKVSPNGFVVCLRTRPAGSADEKDSMRPKRRAPHFREVLRSSTRFPLPQTLMPLRTVTATRYVTPLREGGSLPAVVA